MRLSKGPMLDLKRIIDSTDLRTVVLALATIALDQASALANNGPADSGAERWERVAHRLMSLADSPEVLAVNRDR